MLARCLFVLPILTSSCAAVSRPSQPTTPAVEVKAVDFKGPAVGYPQFPSISPDGGTIVFASAGDLWCVPVGGGVAERLTSHPSDEARSAFSPDGSMLAFESERDGPRNLYVMPLSKLPQGGVAASGAIRRITTVDKAETLSAFSADGKSVYFTAALEPTIFRGTHMYSAPVTESGNAPVSRLTDAFGGSPHPSPDGKEILFNRNRYDASRPAYAGSANTDVYSLDVATKTFKRITSDVRNDAEAFALPDGSVVLVSARSGENNLWRVPRGGAESGLVQLTDFKPAAGQATISHGVRDFSVAPGGSTGVFCVWDTIYTIDLKEAKPAPKAVTVYANPDAANLDFQRMNLSRQVADAALSPDGKTLAVIARGQVFIRSTEKDRPTRRVTNNSFRARDLAWSPDGRVLYFASDDTGVSGMYTAVVGLTREDVSTDDKPKEDAKKPAELEKKPEDAKPEDKKADDAKPGEAKPDEKKKEKKPDWGKRWAESITFKIAPFSITQDEQRNPVPSPDGKKLLLTRGRGDLVMLELDAAGNETSAVPKIKSERVLFPGWNDADVLWAPDSQHIVYAVEDVNYNSDVWLLDTGAADSKPLNLTRHPDSDRSPRLSADGKVLFFLSDRDADSNGDDDVYAINLDKKLDGLRAYELAEYYKDAGEKAKKRKPLGAPATPSSPGAAGGDKAKAGEGDAKSEEKKEEPKEEPKKDAKPEPLVFDTADSYLRVRRLTTGANAGALQITPAADRIMYTTTADGASQLVSVDYKGAEKKTVFAGGASGVQSSLTGEKVLFVSGGARGPEGAAEGPRPGGGGEAYLGKPAGGETEKLAIDAPVTVDIAAQQKQKFLEAARIMGNGFYHPTLKGLDWAALTKRYLELAVKTRTDPEFNRVFLNMLGELNGSHVGISGGRDMGGTGQSVGYLGVDATPVAGGFKVLRVIAGSPADRKSSKLKVGDVIASVNGKTLAEGGQTPAIDLAAAMAGTSGQETLLEIIPAAGGDKKLVLITPYASGADTIDRYKDEVARNRAKVEEMSGGKLGYLHIRAMDMASVRDFERDLFAAADGKLGLIIDVRDNGGGSTNDILLASLTAPRHAFTAARGVDPTKVAKDAFPRDRRLIYGYSRELSVLCNQNSYSNAEIFSHAIKTIKRGKLVGTQTFGAVISTGAATLIDGTTIRTPFRGWYLPDGTDMENHGAMPDIVVPQTPEDETAGKDPQLEAAVKELLTRAKEP